MNTHLKTKGEFKKKYGIRYCPNDFRLEVEIWVKKQLEQTKIEKEIRKMNEKLETMNL